MRVQIASTCLPVYAQQNFAIIYTRHYLTLHLLSKWFAHDYTIHLTINYVFQESHHIYIYYIHTSKIPIHIYAYIHYLYVKSPSINPATSLVFLNGTLFIHGWEDGHRQPRHSTGDHGSHRVMHVAPRSSTRHRQSIMVNVGTWPDFIILTYDICMHYINMYQDVSGTYTYLSCTYVT